MWHANMISLWQMFVLVVTYMTAVSRGKYIKKEPLLKFLMAWGNEHPFAFCHYPAQFINVKVHPRETVIIRHYPMPYICFLAMEFSLQSTLLLSSLPWKNIPKVSVLQDFQTEPCKHLYSLPCMPHVLLISCSVTWSE